MFAYFYILAQSHIISEDSNNISLNFVLELRNTQQSLSSTAVTSHPTSNLN